MNLLQWFREIDDLRTPTLDKPCAGHDQLTRAQRQHRAIKRASWWAGTLFAATLMLWMAGMHHYHPQVIDLTSHGWSMNRLWPMIELPMTFLLGGVALAWLIVMTLHAALSDLCWLDDRDTEKKLVVLLPQAPRVLDYIKSCDRQGRRLTRIEARMLLHEGRKAIDDLAQRDLRRQLYGGSGCGQPGSHAGVQSRHA